MSNKTLNLTSDLYDYLLTISLREHEVLAALREKTKTIEMHQMQIAPEQGQFMAWLVKLMQAKKALELGVYTGYSSLAVALSLPADGQLVACDISEEWTEVGKPFWKKAGVAHKIDLRLAPALDTLEQLLANGEAETFDFAFIDADKQSYRRYYEKILQLLRPGGVVLIDNVLRDGKVIDMEDTSNRTQAIRDFNQHLHQDARIALSLLPVADGLSLALKLHKGARSKPRGIPN